MNRHFYPVMIIFFFSVFLLQPLAASAQNATSQEDQSGLRVSRGAICKDIFEHEPLDIGDSFVSSVDKLYCFTEIRGAQEPTMISHVWYYQGQEQAKVNLRVNAPRWRTYSSKTILDSQFGKWEVQVLNARGDLLDTLEFEIIP